MGGGVNYPSSINDPPSLLPPPTSYKNQRTNKEVFLFIDNRIDPSCSIVDSIKERRTIKDGFEKLGQRNCRRISTTIHSSPLPPRRRRRHPVPRRGSWRSLRRRGTFRGRFALRLITSLSVYSYDRQRTDSTRRIP